MSELREVRTQAKLDRALADDVTPVCVGSGRFSVSGSASVRACDSASVYARGSASVRAYNSASVRAYNSASVRASKYVAVHRHSSRGLTPRVDGGVLIDVPRPSTIEEWCEYRGVDIKDDVVVLYKAVRDDYRSARGCDYTPGSMPVAEDWDGGERECGGGLHFCASAWEAAGFDWGATRYIACPVATADIAVHEDADKPSKVKARGLCAPCWEVDLDGNRIERAEQCPPPVGGSS